MINLRQDPTNDYFPAFSLLTKWCITSLFSSTWIVVFCRYSLSAQSKKILRLVSFRYNCRLNLVLL